MLDKAKNADDAIVSARLFNEIQDKICRLQARIQFPHMLSVIIHFTPWCYPVLFLHQPFQTPSTLV